MDVFGVADLLVDLTRRTRGDSVAIIAYYGSYAIGTASEKSDLDIYYIPDDDKAGDLYRSLVYDGRAFEFWPVSWDFAGRIASGKHRWSVAPSIIANAQVVYARSEADRARFVALHDQIAALQMPEKRLAMVRQALETFKAAAFHLDRMGLALSHEDPLGARWAGIELINVLLDCLALASQTFFPRTWSADLAQLDLLTVQPEGLCESIETIVSGDDLHINFNTAADLVMATRAVLFEQQQSVADPVPAQRMFSGYYAGVYEYVLKVVSACARNDRVAAGAIATQLQAETALMLAQAETGLPVSDFNVCCEYRAVLDEHGFPDMAAAVGSADFDRIAALAWEFDARARAYFDSAGVPLAVAETVDELKALIG
jgi:hypothetical protein